MREEPQKYIQEIVRENVMTHEEMCEAWRSMFSVKKITVTYYHRHKFYCFYHEDGTATSFICSYKEHSNVMRWYEEMQDRYGECEC